MTPRRSLCSGPSRINNPSMSKCPQFFYFVDNPVPSTVLARESYPSFSWAWYLATHTHAYQPSKAFFRNADLRAEQNKLHLLKAPVKAAKLAARPELQNNNMIKLRTFAIERDGDFDIPFITYRHISQEARPPRGLQLPC